MNGQGGCALVIGDAQVSTHGGAKTVTSSSLIAYCLQSHAKRAASIVPVVAVGSYIKRRAVATRSQNNRGGQAAVHKLIAGAAEGDAEILHRGDGAADGESGSATLSHATGTHCDGYCWHIVVYDDPGLGQGRAIPLQGSVHGRGQGHGQHLFGGFVQRVINHWHLNHHAGLAGGKVKGAAGGGVVTARSGCGQCGGGPVRGAIHSGITDADLPGRRRLQSHFVA